MLLLVLAQGAAARWYQVDVVVFRHAGSMSTGGEQWPALQRLPDYSSATRLITALPDLTDEPVTGEVAFKPLARAQWRLAGVARRLQGGNYETLLATAWRQPSFGVEGARRVYLSDREVDGVTAPLAAGVDGSVRMARPRVEGTVAIKVARLLHVAVDFVFDHDGAPVRLAETRKVKLRETHYFDHPLFGVIVQVAPVIVPDAVPGAAADEPEDPGAEPGATAD